MLNNRLDLQKLVPLIHDLRNNFYIPYLIGVIQTSLTILGLYYVRNSTKIKK